MKIHPVGDEALHANGQADIQAGRHDEANGRFLKFCERAYKLNISFDSIQKQGSNIRVFYNSTRFTEWACGFKEDFIKVRDLLLRVQWILQHHDDSLTQLHSLSQRPCKLVATS
jgi:hypothetical protein